MVYTKARTKPAPRRSHDRVALVFLAVVLLACQPNLQTRAKQQIDRAVAHMEAAAAMLEAAHGDQRQLLEGALAYRSEHHAELHQLRTDGEALWAQLDTPTRDKLSADANARTQPLLARMANAAQKFANPRQALMLVQPFLLQASAHSAPAAWQPWRAEEAPEPSPPTGTSR